MARSTRRKKMTGDRQGLRPRSLLAAFAGCPSPESEPEPKAGPSTSPKKSLRRRLQFKNQETTTCGPECKESYCRFCGKLNGFGLFDEKACKISKIVSFLRFNKLMHHHICGSCAKRLNDIEKSMTAWKKTFTTLRTTDALKCGLCLKESVKMFSLINFRETTGRLIHTLNKLTDVKAVRLMREHRNICQKCVKSIDKLTLIYCALVETNLALLDVIPGGLELLGKLNQKFMSKKRYTASSLPVVAETAPSSSRRVSRASNPDEARVDHSFDENDSHDELICVQNCLTEFHYRKVLDSIIFGLRKKHTVDFILKQIVSKDAEVFKQTDKIAPFFEQENIKKIIFNYRRSQDLLCEAVLLGVKRLGLRVGDRVMRTPDQPTTIENVLKRRIKRKAIQVNPVKPPPTKTPKKTAPRKQKVKRQPRPIPFSERPHGPIVPIVPQRSPTFTIYHDKPEGSTPVRRETM